MIPTYVRIDLQRNITTPLLDKNTILRRVGLRSLFPWDFSFLSSFMSDGRLLVEAFACTCSPMGTMKNCAAYYRLMASKHDKR